MQDCRAAAHQRNQGCPDRKLESQNQEPAERRSPDGPPAGCKFTAGEKVHRNQKDHGRGSKKPARAAKLATDSLGNAEKPLGPTVPPGHPCQDPRNEGADGQAMQRGRGQDTQVSRPWSQTCDLRHQHEIGGPDRRPGQPQQQGSNGSSHVSGPRISSDRSAARFSRILARYAPGSRRFKFV